MKTKNLVGNGLCALLLLIGNIALAQTTLSGTVVDAENNEAIPGANIIVLGSNTGTVADFDGKFTLNTSAELPLTIEVSYVGFGSKSIEVISADQVIEV
jgi:iron complex outermembrane receptor protein